MGPFPRPERQSDENESHEKSPWPWETAPEEKDTKKKPSENEKKVGADKKTASAEKKAESKKEQQEQKTEVEGEKPERRSTLIEQSLALVAQYEEEPIPRDATTLARLMIAHQVVHLHSRLEHPEQPSDLNTEEIEATLDYIAKLDAKFQDPTVELEPEIEQSYQEVMELAAATLEETPNPESIIHDFTEGQDNSSPTEHSPHSIQKNQTSPNTWADQEFERRRKAAQDSLPAVAMAAALIYAVTHLGTRQKKTMTQPTETTRDENNEEYFIADAGSSSAPRLTQTTPHSEQLASRASGSEYIPTSARNEHVVVPPRRVSPTLAAAAIATNAVAPRSQSEALRPFSTAPAPFSPITPETPQSKFESPINEQSIAQRKIENLPLPQLLVMAETISLGHGHYLRREFEAGHIDKEDLIKILKSHAKGLDYRFEFRQQANKFAKLKATSPEFLHTIKQINDEPGEHTEQIPQETTNAVAATPVDLHKAQPLSLAPPTRHDLLPEIASSAHTSKHTIRRLLLITIAALAGLVVVGWLALTIFNALS